MIANATAEGIPLSEITIRYEGLNTKELLELQKNDLVTHDLGGGAVLAKFPLVDRPQFETKATAVLYLGA